MAVTKAYNGDFDGDEMNLLVNMDEKTRAESKILLSVKNNMVKDGVPIICFQQNTIAAAYLMRYALYLFVPTHSQKKQPQGGADREVQGPPAPVSEPVFRSLATRTPDRLVQRETVLHGSPLPLYVLA